MTISAGSIQYQVEIETAQVLTGSQNVNKSLDGLQTGFNKTDKAAANSSKSMGTLGKSMSAAGGEASKFGTALTPLAGAIAGIISVQAIANLQKLSEQFTLLESRVKRLSATAADAKTNYAALIQISSAGGSDLTTTIKLWESLTASLVSLGVTRDQVLSLTDTLQKIGKIGGSSAEEISAALRQFSQAVAGGTLRAEEFNSIIEQMPELGRKIADGLGIPFNELRQQMLDGKLTIDRVLIAIQEQTGKVNAEFKNVPRSVGDASNAIVNSMGVAISKIDQAAGASRALATALDAVAKGIRLSSGQLDDQQQLNKLVTERATAEQQYATQIKFGLKETAAATETRIKGLNDEIKAIQDRKVAQQKAEGDKLKITAPANAPKTDSQKAIDKLREEAAAAKLTGDAKARLLAIQKLGDKATESEKAEAASLGAEIYKLDTATKTLTTSKKKAATEAETAAKKAAAVEKKELTDTQKVYEDYGVALANVAKSSRDLAMDEAELKLARAKSIPTAQDIKLVRDLAAAQFDAGKGKQLAGEFDPGIALNTDLAKKKADLEIANQVYIDGQKLLSAESYLAAKQKLEKDYNAQMAEIEIQRFAAQSTGNAAMVAGFEALATSGTQALGGLLSGTMSLQDALGGIANTVLNAVIGSFVQAGVDFVKQEFVKQAAVKATEAAQIGGIAAVTATQAGATGAIAATTTTTAATTGAAVATSMAPAAGLSSIASFGGAAVIGGSALLATMLLAKSFSGKALGGPVQADGMYRVNETGAPEIFNAANGRQYMMPNSRGDVVSHKDATSGGSGGGAAPVVNVHNYSGQQANVTSKFSEADRAYIIDVVVGDGMGDGKTGRMINSLTGTRRQGT